MTNEEKIEFAEKISITEFLMMKSVSSLERELEVKTMLNKPLFNTESTRIRNDIEIEALKAIIEDKKSLIKRLSRQNNSNNDTGMILNGEGILFKSERGLGMLKNGKTGAYTYSNGKKIIGYETVQDVLNSGQWWNGEYQETKES